MDPMDPILQDIVIHKPEGRACINNVQIEYNNKLVDLEGRTNNAHFPKLSKLHKVICRIT